LPVYIIAIAHTLFFVTVYNFQSLSSVGVGSILYFDLFTRQSEQGHLKS